MQKQRQEGNHEDQKDGYDTTPNPIKDRDKIVAPRLAANNIPLGINSTNSQLFVEGPNKEHWKVYQPNPVKGKEKKKEKKDAQVIINI